MKTITLIYIFENIFNMRILLNQQAFDLFNKYNIKCLDYKAINSTADLKKIKFPIVMKISSSKIVHKTEMKAVRVTTSFAEGVKNFNQMRKYGHVVYQPFFSGRELIIGVVNDRTFGQVLMFGLGGIFTEVLKDVSFRACPITKRDAFEMMKEIKGSMILNEFRGHKAINKDDLAEVLVKLSKLAVKENVHELDINPYMVSEKTGLVVDARIVLEN